MDHGEKQHLLLFEPLPPKTDTMLGHIKKICAQFNGEIIFNWGSTFPYTLGKKRKTVQQYDEAEISALGKELQRMKQPWAVGLSILGEAPLLQGFYDFQHIFDKESEVDLTLPAFERVVRLFIEEVVELLPEVTAIYLTGKYGDPLKKLCSRLSFDFDLSVGLLPEKVLVNTIAFTSILDAEEVGELQNIIRNAWHFIRKKREAIVASRTSSTGFIRILNQRTAIIAFSENLLSELIQLEKQLRESWNKTIENWAVESYLNGKLLPVKQELQGIISTLEEFAAVQQF